MKWWTPIISALLVAACAWTPERANPYDPGSDRYVDPPQANRAPVIRSLVVNTNCVNFPTEDQCGVLITAQIDDADNNLDLTRVQATITWPDSLPQQFGTLLYFPIDTAWKLEKLETELLYPAEQYVGSLITVTAADDSGAIALDTVRYPRLFRDYPQINWPEDGQFDCVCPGLMDFSWNRWTGEGQAREMELRFYFQNFDMVPSLTVHNVLPTDTFVTVTADFVPADSNSAIFYGWRLFVIDQNGNSVGSEPGAFNYRDVCTPSCGP